MKSFGYAKRKVSPQGLLEMREITFTGSAVSLRQMAMFLLSASEQMEKRGTNFSHTHINEHCPEWLEKWPDIIVARGG